MPSLKKSLILLVALLAVGTGAIYLGLKATNIMLHQELVRDAKGAAGRWAKYVYLAEPKLIEVFANKSVQSGISDVFQRTYPGIRTVYYELYDNDRKAFFISYMNVQYDIKNLPDLDKIIDKPDSTKPARVKVAFHSEGADNQVQYFATVAVPYFASGKLFGYIVSYIDQTDQRAALEQSFGHVAMLIVSIFSISIIGPIMMFVVKMRDQRKASEALHESEELFSKAFLANPDPFSIVGLDGAIYDLNEAWLTTLGYTRREVIGNSALKLGIWADPNERARLVELLKEKGTVNNFEAQYRTKSGELRDMVVSGEWVEVRGEQRLFIVSHDVTESKAAERQLVEHRDHLQELVNEATADLKAKAVELHEALEKEKELNELQQQFVSMASHEFRTPLTIIDGAAQRLMSRSDKGRLTPEDTAQRVEKIRAAVRRMTRLMESTLTAARMQEGKINIEIGPCDIGKVLREVCSREQEVAHTHVISCDLADLPETIQADTGALDQVLTNLLSNAVKYAPDVPDIELKACTEGPHVVISVSDHGIGIDEEDLSRIGERFFRAKTSTGIAGTGIGLNLVKTLTELHGGSINAESKKGEGSTFTIRLPIAGPSALDKEQENSAAWLAANLNGKRMVSAN